MVITMITKNKSTNQVAPPFPPLVKEVGDWLCTEKIMNPTQCIVNEYYRHQGIGKHIDAPQFGPVIVSISMGADTNFIFRGPDSTSVTLDIPRRSALILRDEARYLYTHEIPLKTHYTSQGQRIEKPLDYRRVSLTFRTLK